MGKSSDFDDMEELNMLKQHVFVVMTKPVAGREAEYNDWYSNQHLRDVLKVQGFKTAQRFKLAPDDESAQFRYLAIYEFEGASAAEAMAQLQGIAGTPEMVMSESMDMQAVSAQIWEAITDKQHAV
jgi:hypothetical protein